MEIEAQEGIDRLAAAVAAGIGGVKASDLRVVATEITDGLVLPPGCSWQDLEELLPHPRRPRGCLEMHDLDSVAAYVQRHESDQTIVLVDREAFSVLAIMDHHRPDPENGTQAGGWGEHRAEYCFPRTPEWTAWERADGTWKGQHEFADFIEERALDIHQPNAAEMLELARTMQAKQSVDFKSAIRVESGDVEFSYQQQTEARAGSAGKLVIPERVKLGIRPFRGSAIYEVEARFRYRIKDGGLAMSVQLIRPHVILEDAFEAEVAIFTGKLPDDVPVYRAKART